jgi:thiol-disulfide isomerase/thioredoxin
MRTLAAAALLALVPAAFAISPVPRPAKEFTIIEPSGKQTLLSSMKGKVVYIQFLSTTCPHCQALSRVLTNIQNDLGPKGLQVFGVAFDDSLPPQVDSYKKQFAQSFPVGYAKRDTVLNYLGLSVMERLAVPQVVVIDRKGVIRAQSAPLTTPELQNDAQIRKLLGDLLAEGSAASAKAAKAAPAKN